MKNKPVGNNFVVLADDREKHPWSLPYETKIKRLAVGDYTIEGFEDVIAIEKKSGLCELLNDLAVGYRPTFKRFLKKMSTHPICCIIVERELREASLVSAIETVRRKSNGRMQLTTKTILYWVGEIMMAYGIPILFVDKHTRKDVLPEVFRAAHQQARRLKY